MRVIGDILLTLARWLLKVPLGTIKLVIRVFKHMLSKEKSARRHVLLISCLVGVATIARILVNRSTRKRLRLMSKQSVFLKRFKTRLGN